MRFSLPHVFNGMRRFSENVQLLARFYSAKFLQVQTIVADFSRRCCWFLFHFFSLLYFYFFLFGLNVSETWRSTFNAFFIFDSTCRTDPLKDGHILREISTFHNTHSPKMMAKWNEANEPKLNPKPKLKPIILYCAGICSILPFHGKTNEA